jgi:preprotein translocase subunit SecA
MMNFLRLPEDVPIEARPVSKAIQSAQTQMEQQNFEIRKNVLKYDEVMNKQRTVIYDERREVLEGRDLSDQIRPMIDDVIKSYVEGATATGYAEEWDLEKLWTALKTLYPVSLTVEEAIDQAGGEKADVTREFLLEELEADAQAAYDQREEDLGAEVLRELERRVLLSVLDRKWREHLYEMDYLQEGIGLRAMAQRDPLVEYKREGFDMFSAMMDAIKEESVGFLFNLEVQVEEEAPAEPAEAVGAQPQLDLSMLASAQEAHEDEQGVNANGARPQVTAKGLDRDDQDDKSLVYSSPELGSDTPSVQTTGGTGSTGGTPRKPRPGANRQRPRSNPNRGSRGNKRKR